MDCPKCGLKVEKITQLPSKAPFSKDFEDAVALSCESAAARQVARQFRLAARASDQRHLERWAKKRKKPVVRQMGVDEIYARPPSRNSELLSRAGAISAWWKALLRRERGQRNLRYLLLKAQRLVALKTEFLVLRRAA